jgi:hypothetical protein
LDQYVEEIHKRKLLSEIEKLMFDRSHFARFLASNNFDVKKSYDHFQEYLLWRKNQKIDNLIVIMKEYINVGVGVHSVESDQGVLPKWIP